MVSLALALVLSGISERIGVDILFIDEGSGSLSSEPSVKSIRQLQSLHTTLSRRVGIISTSRNWPVPPPPFGNSLEFIRNIPTNCG